MLELQCLSDPPQQLCREAFDSSQDSGHPKGMHGVHVVTLQRLTHEAG
jgi:hypothetical protein